MTSRGVEPFARRDWREAADSKRAHWAAVYQRQGWRVVWDAAQALSTHMKAQQPGFPDPADRDADLAHHEALRTQFDRAAHAFSRQ